MQLDLLFRNRTLKFIGKSPVILSFIQSVLVRNSEGCAFVGKLLTLLLKSFVFFKINGLFSLLLFQSDAIACQLGMESIDAL